MLSRITAIIFFIAFIAQSFSGQFIILDYYANTAAFAKNCENRARPKMHCNGKCQLMKKMQQEEKKDQQNPERRSANKNEILSSRSFFCSIDIEAAILQNTYPFKITPALADLSTIIFHPPQELPVFVF